MEIMSSGIALFSLDMFGNTFGQGNKGKLRPNASVDEFKFRFICLRSYK